MIYTYLSKSFEKRKMPYLKNLNEKNPKKSAAARLHSAETFVSLKKLRKK